MDQEQIFYSCTLDPEQTHALTRLRIWLTALTRLGGVLGKQCHVHVISEDGRVPKAIVEEARAFGAAVRPVPVLVSSVRGLSALCQAETFTRVGSSAGELVWFMDPALATLDTKRPPLGDAFVVAKRVDVPRPTAQVVRALFGRAGFRAPKVGEASFSSNDGSVTTLWNNANQRLFGIRLAFLPSLVPFWRKWCLWLLDQSDILNKQPVNFLQMGFSLAMEELGQDMQPLGLEWSLPGRLLKSVPENMTPHMMHVDCLIDNGPVLALTGREVIDRRLRLLNQALSNSRTVGGGEGADNVPKANPRRAVPVAANSPRALMQHLVRGVSSDSCLSIVGRVDDVAENPLVPGSHYMTVDSDIARAIRDADPDARIHRGGRDQLKQLRQIPVIIAQSGLWDAPDQDSYFAALKTLMAKATARLVLVGAEYPPLKPGSIAYYGPLTAHVKKHSGWSDLIIAGYIGDRVVVTIDREDSAKSGTDSILAKCAIYSEEPARLRLLADVAYEQFGFFTSTSERALELSWASSCMPADLVGRRILDVGTGVSPLPFFLAEAGGYVDCVDPHIRAYSGEEEASWIKNGYVDYGSLHSNLRSFNQDCLSFQLPVDCEAGYDVVFMLGVIHEFDLVARQSMLAHVASMMAPDALMYATVRLVKDTDWISPVGEGRALARNGQNEQHGHVRELEATLESLGLRVQERRIRRNLPDALMDVMELQCCRSVDMDRGEDAER
ncbi:hypothetical protein [Yunchengibacter salinarum]|uniref:hypothetical protein n=1 Tax=Yunchengibacter salinarum TaxID=3133399 RepID=UPI0035B627E9